MSLDLSSLGPVILHDTTGLDDDGDLGKERMESSIKVMERTDVSLVVVDSRTWGSFEMNLVMRLEHLNMPVIVLFNKADLAAPPLDATAWLANRNIPHARICAITKAGLADLLALLLQFAPPGWSQGNIMISDLVSAGDTVVLATHIDEEAPRGGRLILPQVQTIRDLLDIGATAVVTLPHLLADVLGRLGRTVHMVVADSHVLQDVAVSTPPGIPITTFPVLLARSKGGLVEQARGTLALDRLRPGDIVLVAEACTHHPIADDTGTVRIPRWLTSHLGHDLRFAHVRGQDFPADLGPYGLVIHCDACAMNRREMLGRTLACSRARVPITSYGLTLAHSLGLLERVLLPFPGVMDQARMLPGARPGPV